MSLWTALASRFRSPASTEIEARATKPAPAGGAFLFPRFTDAHVYVDETAALSVDTAFACAALNARSLAMLPAHIMAPAGPDERDGNHRLRDHPVEILLAVQPNPEMTAFQFREALMLDAQLHGNGYAEIERDIMGRPIALWPIRSWRIQPARDSAGAKFYIADGNVTLPSENVFHLRGPSLGGDEGLSVLSYGRQTLGLAVAQERFAASFIANAAAPSGILKVKPNISDEGMKRARAEFEAMHKGPRRAGKVLMGDSDWSWESIGMSPADAEFLAQRRFSVESVCRLFGVPPQKVGDTSKQTFANYEQANIAYLTDGLLPWIIRFEQEARAKLLRATRGDATPFVKLNAAAIVRADIEKRFKAYALGRQWGFFSVNDIRRLEDMELLGPEGDVYLTPLNMGGADNRG